MVLDPFTPPPGALVVSIKQTQTPVAVLDYAVEPPTLTTLRKYGMGVGPYALGLTPEADWLAMLDSQGGVCPICDKVPTPSKSTGKVRFVIEHEHVRGWKKMPPEERRGYVRGLTCWFCNSSYLGRSITVAKAEGVVRYLAAYAERRPS